MHQVLIAAAGFALGAIGRRIVGGVLGDWNVWDPRGKHAIACVLFACCIGGAAAVGGVVWWACIAIGIGGWIGHTVKGLWDAAGMGHLPPDNVQFSEQRFWRDYLFMSLYGLQIVAVAMLVAFCPLVHGKWFAPLLGGLMVAPAYVVAWGVWRDLPMRRGVTGNPLQLAEWLAGGAIGVGLALIST